MDNNLNDWQNDYHEWWQGVQQEFEGRLEKIDAEERMKYTDTWREYQQQAANAGDWMEADWKEFKGRVTQWWNEMEMKSDEAV